MRPCTLIFLMLICHFTSRTQSYVANSSAAGAHRIDKIGELLKLSKHKAINFGANFSVGTDLSLGVQYKNFEIEGARKITNLSKYPFVTINGIYHYGKIFVGYGTKGPVYGLRLQKNQCILSIGRYGPYSNVSLGVSSLAKRKTLTLFTKSELWMMGIQFVTGISQGFHESLNAGHFGRGNSFIDPTISWKNKYKSDCRTPMYPGSTTWAVAGTDAYHLTNLITDMGNLATLTVGITSHDDRSFKTIAKKLILSAIVNRAAFYLSYNQIFK